MRSTIMGIAAALAIVLAVPTLSVADAPKPSGTIVAVAEGVADVKGADGKVYKIKVEEIVAEDLRTGDVVEYDVIEGKPAHVKKIAK